MQLLVDSDGTLKGTRLEFSMTLDEIPRMIQKHPRIQRKLRKVVSPELVVTAAEVDPVTNP